MKFHGQVEQQSLDWLKLRIGKVTASELDSIITPEWKVRTGEGPRTFAYKKAAEVWRNAPILNGGSWSTEQGQMLEDEACGFAALEYGYKVSKMGFCEADDGLSGCSPDGLIGEDSGLELKCPEPPNHVRYCCEGKLPKEYAAQVHGSMFVTGRPSWVFMSYHRGFPPFHLRVDRNEEIMQSIGNAVATFHAQLAECLGKLRAIKA